MSVKAAPVMSVTFGLVSVMVSTLRVFVPTVAGVKLFATVSPPITVSVALAAAALEPALAVESAPAPIEFG